VSSQENNSYCHYFIREGKVTWARN
jgi:hypothetical protein